MLRCRMIQKHTGENSMKTASEKKEKSGLTEELVEVRELAKGHVQKFSTHGLPLCALCGKAQEDIGEHLNKNHDMSVGAYTERHPDWPLEADSSVSMGRGLDFKERKMIDFDVEELFGFRWPGKKRKVVQGFETPGPLTPEIDEGYVFNAEITQVALLNVHLKNKCLTYGPTGSGKTSLWEQIAARLNYNCVRVNFDAGITRADLVGQYVVEGREMRFAYGILPMGMTLPGTIVILDEWDTISEECSFVIQRPLEKNSNLLLMEKSDELVKLHAANVIVATANTAGMGDETGLYSAGTRIQNFSQVNRFEMTIILDYLPAQEEVEILLKRFPDDIDEIEAKALVQVATKVREGFQKNELAAPMSTRDLINWGEKYCIWGDPMKSARYCFVNRSPFRDRKTINGIIKRAFDT